jgi:hypothetical protein
MQTESKTANNMPKHSVKSACPDFKYFPTLVPNAMQKPNNSIISIGSLKQLKNLDINDRLLVLVRTFAP